jgi:DNA-binding response OmpR family regulator
MNARVLIVEDVESTRRSITAVLEKAGYHVTVAADGETALALLDEARITATPYDVIITDIQMGGVDGISVLQAARSYDPLAAVIILTGFGTMDTAVAALRAGASNYLHKPCDPPDLLNCVKEALQQRMVELSKAEAIQTLKRLAGQLERNVGEDTEPVAPPSLPPHSDLPGEHTADDTSPPPSTIRIGLLAIDTQRHSVSFDGKPIHLTPIEYALLRCLAQQPGHVLEYGDIVQRTHGHVADRHEAHALLKPHIYKLRRKISPDYFSNVRGIGYMLEAPCDE